MAQNWLKIIQISPKPRQINPNWPKTLKNRPKTAKNCKKPAKNPKNLRKLAVFGGFWYFRCFLGGFSGFLGGF